MVFNKIYITKPDIRKTSKVEVNIWVKTKHAKGYDFKIHLNPDLRHKIYFATLKKKKA
jgi:hypothetical protein